MNFRVHFEMDEFTKKLIDDFVDEKSAQLRDLADKLNPASLSMEGRRGILRLLHTIKGSARAFGLAKASAAAHELETEFEQSSEPETSKSEAEIHSLRSGLQRLNQLLIEREEDTSNSFPTEFIASITGKADIGLAKIPENFLSSLSEQEESSLAAELEKGKSIFVIEAAIDPANFGKHLIEVREKLSKLGEIIATIPVTEGEPRNAFRFLLISGRALSELKSTTESAGGSIIYSGAEADRGIPLSKVFQTSATAGERFALEQNKKVSFKLSAAELEISSQRAKKLSDALIHLLQNSITHGIQKSGNVSIVSSAVSNGIQIRISDDGRGIDLARVRKLAQEKKLISDEDELSDHDALQLVFRFGLSTAEKVSEFSGRGIGLNAVKTLTEEMHGTIELDSQPSGGTTAVIFLPDEK